MSKSKILSYIVIIGGISVITGWILDIELLKRIYPTFVTMKFSTAVSFLLAGTITLSTTYSKRSRPKAVILMHVVATILLTLLMSSLLSSTILQTKTGIEELFVKEDINAIHTVVPGRPSIGTMVSFILIAVMGNLLLIDVRTGQRFLGGVVTVLGISAIIGYLIKIPTLYYSYSGISTAMAIHTALLFILAGISLFLSSGADKNV